MSDINKQRIKGLRQFTPNFSDYPFSPYDAIPFGTDGQLVDMASHLDLEQQLILNGGNKTSTIEIKEKNQIIITLIIEKFYDYEFTECYYTKVTQIKETPNTSLLQGENEQSILGYQEDNITSTVIGNFTDNITTSVTIYLYKGDYQETSEEQNENEEEEEVNYKFLYKKIISVTPDKIKEQLSTDFDYQPSSNEEPDENEEEEEGEGD